MPLTESPGTLRPMLRLAAPVLAEQSLGILVWFSDRLLVGHYLDTTHQAAITLMAYLLWLVYGMFSTVGIGATAMVARFYGAGDIKLARRVTCQAFLVGAVIAAAVTALGARFAPWAVHFLRLRGEAAELAVIYFNYMLPIIPLIMVETVGIACLRGAGDMVAGLIIMAVVNAVNLAVSWALVLGLGPLPELGWDGVAIGTMCGFVVGGLVVGWMLWRGRAGLRVRWHMLRPNGNLIGRLLWTGLPGGADMLSIIGFQLWFISIINRLGTMATAAHGVAISVESLAFLPGAAFQVAAATLAGQYLGAADPRRAGRSAWMALSVGGGIMVSAGVLIFTTADYVGPLFVRPEQIEVARLAAPLLRTIALAMPALAMTIILSGTLRGAGDTRWPLVFSIVGLLGVRIPCAYWFCYDSVAIPAVGWTVAGWGLGVLGAWYAMVTDLHIRAVLVLSRILQGGWKRVKV